MRGENQYCSEHGEDHEINVYHVCTRGFENKLMFNDAQDYRKAVNILAILAYKTGAKIFAYCLMTNHLHAVIGVKGDGDANRFLVMFKKEYSQYYRSRHGTGKYLRHLPVAIKSIGCDVPYLRNCIAYVLRNPVDSGMVKAAEQYEWSSVRCYFVNGSAACSRPLSEIGYNQARAIIGTHRNISKSGMTLDSNNVISPVSFVQYKFVESIFNYSCSQFWTKMSKVDLAQMEYDLVIGNIVRYNDYELLKRLDKICNDWFHKTSVTELDLRERCKVAGYMHRHFHSGIPQISRLVGIERKVVRELLGKNSSDIV